MSEVAQDPIISLLAEENIPALQAAVATGWDIDRAIRMSDISSETPVNFALSHGKERLLDFLLAHKPDLNPSYDPPLICAIGNGCPMSTLEKLIAHGARLDGTNQVGTNAYQAALYAGRFELLPEIFRLGLSPAADGGSSLRSAAFNRQFAAVKFLVEHGVDSNARRPDMVFPNNPSTVAVAARNGDFAMVKYLVEHGADITLTDEYGDRPYTEALKAKHAELADYLKSLEPAEWHTDTYHLRRIAPYKPPPTLVELLQRADRRIALEHCYPKFIVFHSLQHVKEINWKEHKLLDLLAEVDDFWESGYLVWSPHHKKVAHADYEHGQFTVLCSWTNFIANPSKWIGRLGS
jgi:ankyrin repeat protein